MGLDWSSVFADEEKSRKYDLHGYEPIRVYMLSRLLNEDPLNKQAPNTRTCLVCESEKTVIV